MLKWIVIGFALILGGCATGAADQTLSFDSDSKKSVVVFGWEGLDHWWGKSVLISFRGVDQTYKLDKRAFSASNGNGWLEMKPIEYFVMEVEPGGYIVNSSLINIGMAGNHFYAFCLGTVKFEALQGKANYIGNFMIPESGGAVAAARPNFEAAKARLAEFPGVKQSLTISPMQKAQYPNSECRRGF